VWGVGAILCGLFMVVWFFWGSVMSAKTEKINGTAQPRTKKVRSALTTGHGVANRLTTEKSKFLTSGQAH